MRSLHGMFPAIAREVTSEHPVLVVQRASRVLDLSSSKCHEVVREQLALVGVLVQACIAIRLDLFLVNIIVLCV